MSQNVPIMQAYVTCKRLCSLSVLFDRFGYGFYNVVDGFRDFGEERESAQEHENKENDGMYNSHDKTASGV